MNIKIALAGNPNCGKTTLFKMCIRDRIYGLTGDAAVEGDEVHAVLGMEADHIDEVLGTEGGQVPLVVDDAVIDLSLIHI